MLNTRSMHVRSVVFLLLTFIISSCNEKEQGISRILTEEVIYVSGTSVRLVGRILDLSGEPVSDYGFLIDTNEEFLNPIVISVGNEESLGRFIGETNGLEKEITYFCTSYLDIGDQRIFGNTLTFNSLPPFLFDFSPKLAQAGDVVIVEGANLNEDSKVFFGNVEATVLGLELESRMSVTVPESVSDFNVDVKLIVDDIELVSRDKFSYVTGKWTETQEFPEIETFSETMSFTKDGFLYYGLGVQSDNALRNNTRLWRMDLSSGSWEVLSFRTTARYPFVADSYFGGGAFNFFGGRSFSSDFWYFDGNDFVELAETPFKLYRAISFKLNDRIIVLGGSDEDALNNRQMYSYSISDNSWNEDGFVPFVVEAPSPHFVFNGQLYLFNPEDSYLWVYNEESKKWSQSIEIPTSSRNGGFATVLDDKAYIGMFDLTNDVWELNINSQILEEKIGYPNSKGDAFTETYAFDNKIYYVVNPFTTLQQGLKSMKIWSLDPNDK